MRQVWKFKLEPGENKIQMPKGTHTLSVGWQDGRVVMWASVPGKPLAGDAAEIREFLWVGTGQPIYWDAKFIGTVQDPDGFVWHIFER